MSKPALFGVLVIWLVLITFLVNAITTFDPSSGLSVSNPIGAFENVSDLSTLEQTASLFRIFWSALSFQISGLPVILNLMFQVPTAIIGFMVFQFVRGVS